MGNDGLNELSCLNFRNNSTPLCPRPRSLRPYSLRNVNLVSDNDTTKPLDTPVRHGGFNAEVVPPLCQRPKRLRLVDIEHEDHCVRTAEESRREAGESFLTRRVLVMKVRPACIQTARTSRRTHICSVTISSGQLWCGRVLVIKSAPMVALYPVVNRPEMYCNATKGVSIPAEIERTARTDLVTNAGLADA